MKSPIEWQTDLDDFVSDILSFIEEQILLAHDPADRAAAIDAASGAIPILRERVLGSEHPTAITVIFVLSSYVEDAHWQSKWKNLGKMSDDLFAEETKDVIARVNFVRQDVANRVANPMANREKSD